MLSTAGGRKGSYSAMEPMNRIFLSQVDASFHPDTDIAFGPWCFIGAETFYPRWPELDFIDALSTPESLVTADRFTRDLANALVPIWAQRLNAQHGTHYDVTFWRFVLIGWLLTGVQGCWARYLHAKEFISRYGAQEMSVELAARSNRLRTYSFIDFQHLLRRSPEFDFWLSSLIVRHIFPNSWTVADSADDIARGEQRTPQSISNEKVSRGGQLVRRVLSRLACDWVPGLNWQKIPLSILISAMPRRGRGRTPPAPPDLSKLEIPSEFLAILEEFLTATLPRAYGEDFRELDTGTRDFETYPGRLFIGNFMPSGEDQRVSYARALTAGEKFVSVQHGAGYGLWEPNAWPAELEYPYHAFLSWGWTAENTESVRIVPLPSPWLSKLHNRHEERRPLLSFVGTRVDLRDVRLLGPRPKEWLDYRDMKETFIKALSTKTRDALIYHSYARDNSDLEDESWLRERFPSLNTQLTGLDRSMLENRLLVLDHPGTTLLLAMAANVPTICFWSASAWNFTAKSSVHFARFLETGILHHSPRSAAEQINQRWDNIDSWWKSSEIQAARSAFCREYASSSRWWWFKWITALSRL